MFDLTTPTWFSSILFARLATLHHRQPFFSSSLHFFPAQSRRVGSEKSKFKRIAGGCARVTWQTSKIAAHSPRSKLKPTTNEKLVVDHVTSVKSRSRLDLIRTLFSADFFQDQFFFYLFPCPTPKLDICLASISGKSEVNKTLSVSRPCRRAPTPAASRPPAHIYSRIACHARIRQTPRKH